MWVPFRSTPFSIPAFQSRVEGGLADHLKERPGHTRGRLEVFLRAGSARQGTGVDRVRLLQDSCLPSPWELVAWVGAPEDWMTSLWFFQRGSQLSLLLQEPSGCRVTSVDKVKVPMAKILT